GEGRKGASFNWTKNQELRPEAWSLRLRVTGSTRDLASETETRWEGLGAPPSEHRSDFTRAQFFIVSVDNQLRGPELGRAELDVSAVLLRNEGEHDGCTEAGRCVSSRVRGYTQGLNYGLKWTRSDASLNEWRIGFSGTHNKSGTDLSQRLQAGTPGEQLLWHDHSNDYAFHFADVTWIPALPKEHDLKLGWKWRGVGDRMSGFELQDGVPVSATAAFGASRHVAGQRVEGFVQHDWRPLPQWATSVGLNWTQQRDRITEGDYHAEPQWHLFAPSANLAWKTGEGAHQQWRLSLARTFKKPERDEQLQRPRLHPEASCPSLTLCTPNQVDQPDITGNPALQPERAHGLNLSFEQRWNEDTELTVDAYARQIDGVIAQVLRQQTVVWSAVPRWVLRPENLGEAWTRGLDLGLRWRQVFSDWAPISMTLGVQMVRSRLKTLPGPDNRLADQQPWGLKLGLRQKLKSMPVEWGVDWSAQPGSWTQVDATRSIYQTRMRNLDADANWQLRKDAKLVLNLRNLSRQGKDQMQRILLRQDLWRQTSRQVGYPSLSLRLDLTL
ncbi:MAG: TonB-dependent receptor, partial [Paucibacter sp.]|nr:TonB-dependent receptor [Roseateles sp.]